MLSLSIDSKTVTAVSLASLYYGVTDQSYLATGLGIGGLAGATFGPAFGIVSWISYSAYEMYCGLKESGY